MRLLMKCDGGKFFGGHCLMKLFISKKDRMEIVITID